MAIEADIRIRSISPTICCHVNMTAAAEEEKSILLKCMNPNFQYCT
jgi:hypothetical protein